ncbi:MAG: hypothetical protein HLX51_02790 [Micrococcaceae bacterium]|nr:hypothetical protein [Micrococcaceae bacterium]
MAAASRRKTVWVWVIVLALFAGAAWVAYSTIRSTLQPLAVIDDPFPEEKHRPEASDEHRSAVNFLVFGEAADSVHTLSVFHLADGRRRIDVVNFPTQSAHVSNIDDAAATVAEVEDLTGARMEHVMLWDLEFMAELEDAQVTAEELLANPEALQAQDVWSSVLQEALDTRDPGRLNSMASALTPYVAADQDLDTGRITELAKSLRHVPAENIASCTLPEELSGTQQADLVEYFATGEPTRCAELFG